MTILLWCFCLLPVTHESRIQSPASAQLNAPAHVYPGFHNCSRRSSSSTSLSVPSSHDRRQAETLGFSILYVGFFFYFQEDSSDLSRRIGRYLLRLYSVLLPKIFRQKTRPRSNIHINDRSYVFFASSPFYFIASFFSSFLFQKLIKKELGKGRKSLSSSMIWEWESWAKKKNKTKSSVSFLH